MAIVSAEFEGLGGRIGGNEGPSHVVLRNYHKKTELYHCFWE